MILLDGWYGFRLTQASETPEFRGALPGNTPVFVATKRMDAPWPDVRVCLPLAAWVADQWKTQTRISKQEIADQIGDELEAAAMRAVQSARMGLDPSRQN